MDNIPLVTDSNLLVQDSAPALMADTAIDQFVRQVNTQLYTDPAGVRRLIVQLEQLLETNPTDTGQLRRSIMLGNLANLEYRFSDAVDHFRQARKLAQSQGERSLELELLADYAGALLNVNQVSEAAQLIDAAHALASPDREADRWRIDTREGFLHLRLGALDDALASFAKAHESMPGLTPAESSVKDAYYAALLYAGFGRVYTTGQDLPRAIEAYQTVVDVCGTFNMRGRLPYHYLDLGRAQMAGGQREAAIANFTQAIAVAGEQDRNAIAAASANLGYYAIEDKDWTVAAKRLDAAEHHYRTSTVPAHSDLSVINLWRARMHRAQRQTAKAERCLVESLAAAREGEDKAQLAEVCREIADYNAQLEQYRDAYEYRLLYEEIRQEVEIETREQRLGELELRHEVEERRRESQVLKLKAARLQLKALRAQMNPHFIFNALNSIQQFITGQRADEAAVHLAHFARLMRQSLDYSEREIITLEEEVDFLRNYLDLNQQLRFEDGFTYDITIGDNVEEDLVGLPAMLVQPYVENAIEHGVRLVEHGHISIAFDSPPDDDSLLHITVTDNGVGREQAMKRRSQDAAEHRSMGTTITQHRLQLLNSEEASETAVSYEDLIDTDGSPAGTRVAIVLPITWQH